MADEPLRLALDLPPAPLPPPVLAPPAASPPRREPPFDYTEALWGVVRDVVATLEELRHINLERVLIAGRQARQASKHGLYACCTPLRFEGGSPETIMRGRRYRMPAVVHEGREIFYILYFMLPRFHTEQDYHGKLATIIHELYHISPRCDGDIRRFPGKNFAHGHSRERYHQAMCLLADRYRVESPAADTHHFLRIPFRDLLLRPGGVVGLNISPPHPFPAPSPARPPRAPSG